MAPPRKRKNTVRQRRKQAGRTDSVAVEAAETTEVAPASTKVKPGGKVKKPVAQETWSRRHLAVLVAVAVVLQAIFSAPFALWDWRSAIAFFFGLNPILLAPAAWLAMLLVYRRIGARRMRFLEVMMMAMMMFFVANTVGGYLLGGLETASATPATSPTPSAHSSSKPLQSGNATSRPTALPATTATASPGSRAAVTPGAKVCPVNDDNCRKNSAPAPPLEQQITAAILAMLVGIATTIWGFPTVYRWLWGPKKPRTPPAKRKK